MKITKKEALAFRKRWQLANAKEIEQLRKTTLGKQLEQTAALMASVDAMGWRKTLRSDETVVWERWCKLREKYRG